MTCRPSQDPPGHPGIAGISCVGPGRSRESNRALPGIKPGAPRNQTGRSPQSNRVIPESNRAFLVGSWRTRAGCSRLGPHGRAFVDVTYYSYGDPTGSAPGSGARCPSFRCSSRARAATASTGATLRGNFIAKTFTAGVGYVTLAQHAERQIFHSHAQRLCFEPQRFCIES